MSRGAPLPRFLRKVLEIFDLGLDFDRKVPFFRVDLCKVMRIREKAPI
jgi:hypothetical protein